MCDMSLTPSAIVGHVSGLIANRSSQYDQSRSGNFHTLCVLDFRREKPGLLTNQCLDGGLQLLAK
jgi:hypothetical protein